MGYKKEFRDYDDDLTLHIATLVDFQDTSWHNDLCPSFCNEELDLRVWIDYKELEHRDSPTHSVRYSMDQLESEGDYVVDGTDDWMDILKAIDERRKAQ